MSIRKYKAMLWKAVKDILEIAGYDIAAVEEGLVLNSERSGQIAEPPRGLIGYAGGSTQQSKIAELLSANESAKSEK